jgi:signal transduction histidine kinase
VGGLVLAAREAMANAARFAGVDRIFVLSEAGDDWVRLVVRDRGAGFDPAVVPDDRRGIRESIVGRIERLGGAASIHSAPGEGTEVDLQIGAAE